MTARDPLPIDDPPGRARGLHAVSTLVVRELERAGRLADDRPELALATLGRWLDGEETLAAVSESLDAMAQAVSDDREAVSAAQCVLWTLRVRTIGPDRAREVVDVVVATAVRVLGALGEGPDAADHRVRETYVSAYGRPAVLAPSAG